jgi:hypothetical protein
MTASRHPSFPSALLPCVSRLELQPAQWLFRAGTSPRYIHFIEEGAMRLVRHGRQGEEVVLHDARPGEFLAEASLDSVRYHCDAVASEASAVPRVAKADFPDESKTWQARVIEARELLADLAETAGRSFVSQVRKALAEDSQRVHACLTALKDLDFGGRDGDPGFEQWKAWAELQRHGATEMKEDVPLPDVGAAWHGLVRDLDPVPTLVPFGSRDLRLLTLDPFQYRPEVEISGSFDIAVSASRQQRRANSAGVAHSSAECGRLSL